MKKLLVLLVIAFVGAGIAYGASTLFFSTASNDTDTIEPEGLIDENAGAPVVTEEPTPKPSATPKTSSSGTGTAAAQPSTQDDSPTPKDPTGTSITSKKGVVVEPGIDEGECDENTEAEREACIDDLEAEAEADEEEAEQEADEDEAREEARQDRENDRNNP